MKQATAHINLDAIAHNLNHAREISLGSRVMAVIKANAYGHGAVEVARRLDADAFAVARIAEAVELRENGISARICLLEGVADKEELNLAGIYELELVIHSAYQLELLRTAGARRPLWIKVDTGMGRLGFSLQQACDLQAEFSRYPLLGYMTHLAQASDPDDPRTAEQLAAARGFAVAERWSIANSAGILAHPDSHADWNRPGIMLYGASPFDDLVPLPALQPAMTLTAPVIAVRDVSAGESVGYGAEWTAPEDCRVAVIAAGYADGYPREVANGTPVLLGSERRSIVGRVSMDMICIRLEPADQVNAGDRVTLWGEGLPVEVIAKAAGTITYTLLSGVTSRVPRKYRGEVGYG